jgi:hypothetical protein
MTRFLPWGFECLPAHLRVACAIQSVGVPEGPSLDLGAGASLRGADHRCELGDDPAAWPEVEAALVVAWPGPGALEPAARPAWWRAVSARLRPGGVAAVRLDLHPGWHPLTAIQDFARFYAVRQSISLPEALDAVFALAHDALGGDDGRWYGWLQHIEALRRDDPWAVPDLVRAPIYPAELHAWAGEAAAAGLSWFGDGRGAQTTAQGLAAPLVAWIDEEVSTRADALRGQQIADYALNQHTRLALFTKGPAHPPAHAKRWFAGPSHDRPAWWALERPEPSAPSKARATFDEVDPRDPAVAAAWRLGQISLADAAPPIRPHAADLPDGLTLTPDGRCEPKT